MDFLGGALPNVMFIVGIIIIGAAIGIQFKIVEIDAQLSKNGRIAAFIVGALLIGTSVYLHINPQPATPTTAEAEPAPAPTEAPTAQPAAPAATVVAAAPVETPTAVAPAVPTVAEAPPQPVSVSQGSIIVPDVRNKKPDEAQRAIERASLRAVEQDTTCEEIGATPDMISSVKKDRVMCQFPAPGSKVAVDALIYYVVYTDSGPAPRPGPPGPVHGDDDNDDDDD